MESKIKIAPVGYDDVAVARQIADKLGIAVRNGKMKDVDRLTAELIELGDEKNAVCVSEDHWRRFISIVREQHPDFKSDYIVEYEMLHKILQLNLGEEFSPIISLMNDTYTSRGAVIQISIIEEDRNV